MILTSLDDPGRELVSIVSQKGDPKDERWLQDLLYCHPELLPVGRFDESFSPPIPIGREVPTDRGLIDNLYISPDGKLTVIETKLWKNPEKHREVVAQIIDYASQLAGWEYDRLREAILISSRKRGETEAVSIEEKVQPALDAAGVRLHEFQEGVAAALSRGEFLLLVVGDRISPNIALMTKAIHSAPGLHFRIGLVEMQMYQSVSDAPWPLLIVPEIVGHSVEVVRGVVEVRYRSEKPHVTVSESDEEDPMAVPHPQSISMSS